MSMIFAEEKKSIRYEDEKRHSFLYDEKYVCVFWKPGVDLDEEAAKATMAYALEHYVRDGQPMPTLVEMSEIKSFSREARDLFQNQNTHTSSALALVVSSMMSRVMGNLFISMNQSGIPLKLFNDQNQAMNWLENYV